MSHEEAIELVRQSMQFIVSFDGEMPGGKREECGNYLDHDVPEAREVAADMLTVLQNWTEEDLKYKE